LSQGPAGGAVEQLVEGKADAASPFSPGVWRNRQPGMSYRRLGRTGFMVSEFGFGCTSLVPTYYRNLQLAVEMGLNYIDTAEQYGDGASERAVSKVISGANRDRVFVVTKVSSWEKRRNDHFGKLLASLPEADRKAAQQAAEDDIVRRRAAERDYFGNYFAGQDRQLRATALSNVLEARYGATSWRKDSAAQIIESVEASLRRLKTDHLDILICPHAAGGAYEVTSFPETLEAFERLRRSGKVAHLGVSAHSDPAGVIRGAIQAKVYSMAMVAYNIVNHAYVDRALDEAAAADLGIVAMKVARPVHPNRKHGTPVPEDWLRRLHSTVPGKAKVPLKAYAFALRNRHVAAVNSEMLSTTMVRENLALGARKAATK